MIVENDAHVPTQLISPDEDEEYVGENDPDDCDEDNCSEFASVNGGTGGAPSLAGFSGNFGSVSKRQRKPRT